MKRSSKIAVGSAATIGLAFTIAAAFAHPGGMGPGMMMKGMRGPMSGPMAGGMQHGDAAFQDDTRLVHAMLFGHDKIKRTVANLPNGIRTATESDDPQVARAIKSHVASMEKRLGEGRIFNLFSPTLPVLFENKDKILTAVETTENGSIVTQTSSDPKVVAALQAHAAEVSELARDGMAAFRLRAGANRAYSGTRRPRRTPRSVACTPAVAPAPVNVVAPPARQLSSRSTYES